MKSIFFFLCACALLMTTACNNNKTAGKKSGTETDMLADTTLHYNPASPADTMGNQPAADSVR